MPTELTFAYFQALLVPGARVRYQSPGGRVFLDGTVTEVDWDHEPPQVRCESPDNPDSGLRAWTSPIGSIVDVLPDKDDPDAVETWLARGPLANPFRAPDVH